MSVAVVRCMSLLAICCACLLVLLVVDVVCLLLTLCVVIAVWLLLLVLLLFDVEVGVSRLFVVDVVAVNCVYLWWLLFADGVGVVRC